MEQQPANEIVLTGSATGESLPAKFELYRHRPGKKVAGVSSAFAAFFGVSVTFFRALVILLALAVPGSLILYGLLWLLIPNDPGETSLLDRLLGNFRLSGISRRFEQWMVALRGWLSRARYKMRHRRSTKGCA